MQEWIWPLVAGIFMLISVALSFYAMLRHLFNYTKPYLQRYIIRILLMVPIYSLNAWIAMILPQAGVYLDSLREMYESFVIYSFMKYLLNFLQYDTNLQQYIDYKPGPEQIFPLCLLPNCVGGRAFMIRCKHGILQYVVIRPMTTMIAFISQLFNFYGEGNYNPLSGYTYPVLLLINNASQILAMYCLVIFYTGYHQELRPMRPLAKFFSIKLVVFFSFFQSVVISGMLEIPMVEEFARNLFPDLQDKVAIGRKLQEFLICFDMFIAAIGHIFAFPHKQFVEDDDGSMFEASITTSRHNRSRASLINNKSAKNTCCAAFCNILDFTDEKSDVSEHFSQIFQQFKLVFTRNTLPAIAESTNTLMNPSTSTMAGNGDQQSDDSNNNHNDHNNNNNDDNNCDSDAQNTLQAPRDSSPNKNYRSIE